MDKDRVVYILKIKPIGLKIANKFVVDLHRHHKEVRGHKFAVGCFNGDKLVGVAICGRPVARHLDKGLILEVTRVCTDGTKNSCSKLYSACARIAKELGYDKIITYTLQSETGHSIKASGWIFEGAAGGKNWISTVRKRTVMRKTLFGEEQKYPEVIKNRWSKKLN